MYENPGGSRLRALAEKVPGGKGGNEKQNRKIVKKDRKIVLLCLFQGG